MDEHTPNPPAADPDKPRGLGLWLVRERKWLLILSLLLFAVSWPIADRLTYDRSIESLYAPDDPHLEDYLESKALFGGDELAIVAYTDPKLFAEGTMELSPEAERRIRWLAGELSRIEGVRAESTEDLASASERKPVRLIFRMKVALPRDVLYSLTRGILLGHDDKTTAVVLRLEPQQTASVSRSETIREIREVADRFTAAEGFPVHVVGEPVQVEETFRYVEEDGRELFYFSLACLGVVLVLLFRSWRWVLLPLLIVVVTIRWTEAILVVSGSRLSMVSSMLNSLVTIIGVATVAHLSIYYREIRQTADRETSVAKTLTILLPAIFWTITTTALGFAAVLTSHVTPVKSFGLMMTLASLLVLVALAGIFPGGALLGRWSPEPKSALAEQQVVDGLLKVARSVKAYPVLLAAGFLAIVAVAGAGFLWIEVETDFSKNFREDSPIVQALNFVEDPEHFAGAGSWEVNFPAPEKLTEEYLEMVSDLAERLRRTFVRDDQSGEVTKVLSITDATDPETGSGDLGTEWYQNRSLAQRLNLLSQLQPEFVPSLYNARQERMRIVLRARERQPAERKLQLIAEVQAVAQEWADENLTTAFPDPQVKVTGLFVLLAHLIQSLLGDQIVSFLISTMGILTMMTVAFKSLRLGIICVIPNVFPIVFVIGGMGWAGVPINIATAMIASVSMGLTVDASIHYMSGYLRLRKKGLDVDEALQGTQNDVGRALVYSNLALVAGFGVLTLSEFIPLVYFGVLVSVAMLGGLAGNLLLLPLLLRWNSRYELPQS
jgi:predicted RND superfamily exporter protein